MRRAMTSTQGQGRPTGPGSPIRVRPATQHDAPAIADIRVRGWQSAYRGQLDDALLDELSAEADVERWRAHLSAPPAGWRGFIAERGGLAVGFVTGGPSRDPGVPGTGEIYAIYVRPEDLGTGVGRMLLQRAVAVLAADGYRELTLWVLGTNTAAQRFYRAAGFEPDGAARRDQLDRFVVDEIRFRRRLP